MNGITTHPCWFNPVYGWVTEDPRNSIELNVGNDVWIGANVTIMPSCKKIGNGAIIAAGSVLTKDTPPYEVWGGVPARKIRDRFPEELKKLIDESEWWNIPEEELKQLVNDFGSPEVFVEKIKKHDQ